MNKGHLLNPDGSPWSTGNSGYYSDYEYGNFNLLVAIKFSLGEDSANFHGLLDTGSEWVVFSKEFIESYEIQIDNDPNLKITMNTQYGKFHGYLNRIPLILIAENGTSLQVESTCFISKDWPGPPVIGWKGCLERLRFALDPSEDIFYFGSD